MATEVEKKSGLKGYFNGVRAEMKKVVWLSKKDLFNYTSVVIAISLLVAFIVYLLDLGIGALFQYIVK